MKSLLVLIFSTQLLLACSIPFGNVSNEKTDLSVLKPGSARDVVLWELGPPANSIDTVAEEGDLNRQDIFNVTQGRFAGGQENLRVRVSYDDQWKVTETKVFDKDAWVTIEELKFREDLRRKEQQDALELRARP